MKNKNKAKQTAPKAKTSTPKAPKANKPGRPRYVPKVPKGKFTFTDLELENGVNPETGKGDLCTRLTLRHWMKDELKNTRSGLIIKLKDVLAEPNNDTGLGRKAFVFTKRAGTASVTPKASKTITVVSVTPPAPENNQPVEVNAVLSLETQDYEAKKAELLGSPSEATIIQSDIVNETHETTDAPVLAEPIAA